MMVTFLLSSHQLLQIHNILKIQLHDYSSERLELLHYASYSEKKSMRKGENVNLWWVESNEIIIIIRIGNNLGT